MDRVFLDANILFSAAYRPESGIRQLWQLPGLTLVSSLYAVEEARRNLLVHRPLNLTLFGQLLDTIHVVFDGSDKIHLPSYIKLASKDMPILNSAITAKCTHLLTGDKQHFGELFGMVVEGVNILTPAEYIRQHRQP